MEGLTVINWWRIGQTILILEMLTGSPFLGAAMSGGPHDLRTSDGKGNLVRKQGETMGQHGSCN